MIEEVPQAEEEKGEEEKKDDEKPVEKTEEPGEVPIATEEG